MKGESIQDIGQTLARQIVLAHLRTMKRGSCICSANRFQRQCSAALILERNGGDLFKPDKRFHSGVEGKGLGMFLVKSHINMLGGKIDINSKPDEGTSFVILVPNRP